MHAVLLLAAIAFGLFRLCMEEQINPPVHSFDLPPPPLLVLNKSPSGTSKAASWLHSTHDSMQVRSHDTLHSTQHSAQRTRYSRSPSPTERAATNGARNEAIVLEAIMSSQQSQQLQQSPHAADQNDHNSQNSQTRNTAASPAVSPTRSGSATPLRDNVNMQRSGSRSHRLSTSPSLSPLAPQSEITVRFATCDYSSAPPFTPLLSFVN